MQNVNTKPAQIVSSVIVGSALAYVTFENFRMNRMMKKGRKLMADHDAFMADPFANFSDDAKRVLYGNK